MNLEEYEKHLKDMTEEELEEHISEIRKNRTETMSAGRIKATKKKTKQKNAKSAISDLSPEEKAKLIELLQGGSKEDE